MHHLCVNPNVYLSIFNANGGAVKSGKMICQLHWIYRTDHHYFDVGRLMYGASRDPELDPVTSESFDMVPGRRGRLNFF